MTTSRSWSLTSFGLIVGFLAFAIGVLVAYGTPATAYEISIYGSTPTVYWILIAIALLCSLTVSVMGESKFRTLGLFLGGISTLSIVALPVIRGYYFLGAGDSLTHLGWARDIVSGQTGVSELLYPGIHSFAILLSMLTGYSLEHSFLLVVLSFVALTFLIVPRIALAIFPQDDAVVVIATFSTFLLLPINTISTHMAPHTFTQAIFFGSLVVYLFLRYLTSSPSEGSRFRATPIGVLLTVAAIATVLYHPLQALNILILFGLAALVQFAARRTGRGAIFTEHRPLYAQTVILFVAFFVWIAQRAAFLNTVGAVGRTVNNYLAGTPPTAAGSAVSQGASLQAIGVGLEEIFFKLFLVSAIYGVFMGVLVVAGVFRRLGQMPETNAKIQYLALGVLGTVPFALIYIVGNIGELHFRLLGYLMLIATVLGSVAITIGAKRLSSFAGARATHISIVALFVLLLPLALVAVFPSPYIYQPNQQVTETQLDGYQQAFELHNESLTITTVRQGPWRYNDAVLGVEATEEEAYDTFVPDNGLASLDTIFDGQGYLAVTQYDRERELVAYKELRYSQEGFDALDGTSGVNKVISNGDFTLYFVDGVASQADSTNIQQSVETGGQSTVIGAAVGSEESTTATTRVGGGDDTPTVDDNPPDRAEAETRNERTRNSGNQNGGNGDEQAVDDTPSSSTREVTQTQEPVETPDADASAPDETDTTPNTGAEHAAVNDTRVARVERENEGEDEDEDDREKSTNNQRESRTETVDDEKDETKENEGKAEGKDKDKENEGKAKGKDKDKEKDNEKAKGRDKDRDEARDNDKNKNRGSKDDKARGNGRNDGRDTDEDEEERQVGSTTTTATTTTTSATTTTATTTTTVEGDEDEERQVDTTTSTTTEETDEGEERRENDETDENEERQVDTTTTATATTTTEEADDEEERQRETTTTTTEEAEEDEERRGDDEDDEDEERRGDDETDEENERQADRDEEEERRDDEDEKDDDDEEDEEDDEEDEERDDERDDDEDDEREDDERENEDNEDDNDRLADVLLTAVDSVLSP